MEEPEHIHRVICGGEIYAVVIRGTLPRKGYNFVSENTDSMQVGVNHYDSGATIRAHFHLPVERALSDTLEVLHFDSGVCLMEIYDEHQKKIYETQVRGGDTVVLMKGGHGFKVLEPTRIIEVKQGPYLGQSRDKVFFEG
jgi:hypothetical protein